MKQANKTCSFSSRLVFLQSKALAYITKVKSTFIKNDETHKFDAFLWLLTDYSEQKISLQGVRDGAVEIFKGRDDLIHGLNEFFPEGSKITIEEEKETEAENIQESWKWKSLLYVAKVKDTFKKDSTGKLEIFDDLIRDIGTENFDFDDFGKKLKRLFEGHNELILDFNEFMPEGNGITINTESMNLVEQVKLRFPNNKRVYRAFKDILLQLLEGDQNELFQEFSVLFRGHDDLIDEFKRRYVGDNQSNQVEDTEENTVRKLRSRQVQHVSPSDQQYRIPSPSSRSNIGTESPFNDDSIWRWGRR